jgi:hypothetical protein
MNPGYSSTLDFSRSILPDKLVYSEAIHVDLEGKKVKKEFTAAFKRIYEENQ